MIQTKPGCDEGGLALAHGQPGAREPQVAVAVGRLDLEGSGVARRRLLVLSELGVGVAEVEMGRQEVRTAGDGGRQSVLQ